MTTPENDVLMPVADTTPVKGDVLTAEGGLRGGRCHTCGAGSFPRAYICPTCNGTDIDETSLPSSGTLYSWTTVHVSSTFETPYTLGYVDLTDGLRVLAQLIVPPDELSCDLPVHLERSETSPTGWGFCPSEGASA